MHTAGFHQLDVYAVIDSFQGKYVIEPFYSLIGDNRQRRTLGQPCRIIDILLSHRLLYKQASPRGKPVTHIQGFLLVGPPLVGVNAYRDLRTAFPDRLHQLPVIVKPHLDFQDFVWRCFGNLAANHIGSINAYCKGCIRCVVGIESPYPVPGLTHYLTNKIVQGDVHCSFGSIVTRRDAIHIIENFFYAERISELSKIQRREKAGH